MTQQNHSSAHDGFFNGIVLIIIILAAAVLFMFLGGKKMGKLGKLGKMMRAEHLRIDLSRNEIRSIDSIDRQMTAKYGGD
jgi:hypothetical protein